MPGNAVRTYSAGNFALEIEGKHAGWLSSVEGGGVYGVVSEQPVTNGPTDKSIAAVGCDDVVITCGVPEPALATWLSGFLAGQAPAHDGAVVFLDRNYQPLRRLEWTKGSIVSVTWPRLDSGGAKTSAQLTIAIRPASTQTLVGTGGGVPKPTAKAVSKWTGSSFTLRLPGIDCSMVNSIEALAVTQTFSAPTTRRGSPKPDPLGVGDLVVEISEVRAADFVAWADDFLRRGNNGPSQEKTAILTALDSSRKFELLTLKLSGVGLWRLEPSRQQEGMDSVSRLRASMYCEAAELTVPVQPPPPTTPPPSQPAGDALREYLGRRLSAEQVARRLAQVAGPDVAVATDDRQLGFELGAAWAQRTAALSELTELAAAADREWSSISLGSDHSLVEVLERTEAVALQHDGELELSRDAFVEGLLQGVRQAFTEVEPHLRELHGT
jgi:hypothetical protein